jgi:NADPH:quinone reductase-like Zn-dependent oxidoreductase
MYMVADYQPKQSILWHAGASNVSIAGIQLSKAESASKIFATTRSDEKNKFVVEKLGATAAYNSETQDWAEEILKATDGKGVDCKQLEGCG